MYSIYLTETAKEEMQNKSLVELEKISERLNFLQNGYWKNGTRVKKIKGVNKIPIFEARVDKANRMLFTPVPMGNDGIKKTAIMIFHLSVEHDKVIRTAKSIWGEEFNQETYSIAEETNETLEQIVEEVEFSWNPKYYYTLTNLKMYELDEDTLIRFMQKEKVAPDEFWDIKLRLTEEQQEVLKKSLPVLMSGTAGSGKTTIAIHKLLSEPNVKKIYLTYNKELVEEAKRQFLSLIRGLDEEQLYKENTKFHTFEEILKPFRRDEFLPIMSKDRFVFEYSKYARGQQLDKQFPPLMVWEEIKGVWKSGAFTRPGHHMVLEAYLALNEQEAPNFIGKRDKAFKIFEWYQNWLKENSMMDEQDLLYEALNSTLTKFGMVICDEVQDLSMLHIYLVFALADYDPSRIILTGDDQQVIQHSGFRWENIKNAFFQKLNAPINEIVQLSKNFRNSGKIVKLATAINDLQREYTDFQYKTKETNYYDYGQTPVLYKNINEELLIDKVNQFGPQDAVLVRNEEVRQALSKRFTSKFKRTPLIFTIAEAKGLEFQRVLLWSIFLPSSEEEQTWEKVFRILERKQNHLIENNSINQRFIRYEASLLYVAVTRGIKDCLIYDGPEISAFWKINNIPKMLNIVSEVENIETVNAEIPVSDWYDQGMKLLNKKLYHQALECFERVPESLLNNQKLLCEAYIAKELTEYTQAAEKFILAEYFEEALHCLDVSGQYVEAQKLCEIVIHRNGEDIQKVTEWEYYKNSFKVKEFDQKKQWVGSAIYCKKIGKYIEAANRFEKANPNIASNTFLQQLFDEMTRTNSINDEILERAIDFYRKTRNPKKLNNLLQYKKLHNL